MQWQQYRTVRLEPEAQRELDAAMAAWARLNDAWRALEWLLARKAPDLPGLRREIGEVLYHLYKQAGDDLANTPNILVVFTCTNDLVAVQRFRFSEPTNGDDDYEIVLPEP